MNRLRWVVLALVAMLFPMAVLAQEAGAARPVWWGDVQLWELIAGVVVFVWGVVKAKYALGEKMDARIEEFLEMGVQKAYDTFVRSAKATSNSGKLTVEQINQARDEAWKAAQEYARVEGVDLAKRIAAERLPALLTAIVHRFKNRQ